MTSELDKRNRKSPVKAKSTGDVIFINYDLTESERAACKKWCVLLDDLDAAMVRAVEEGYRLSLKWDTFSECHAAFMLRSDEEKLNAGYILTGRGSTSAKALRQMLFKHFMLFEGDWGAWAKARKDLDLDD